MTQDAVARFVTRVGQHSITTTGKLFFVLDETATELAEFHGLDAARQFAAEREARR